MSRQGLRVAAVGFGLLAFVLRLLVTFWWQPVTWRVGDSAGLRFAAVYALYGLGMVVALLVPFGGYLVLVWRQRRPPTTFSLRDGRFVVRSSPFLFGVWSILLFYFAGGMIPTERVPNEYAMRPYTDPLPMFLVAATLVAAMIAVGVALPFLSRPRVELAVAGVLIQRFRSQSVLAWTLLAPGGPVPPARRSHQIWLFVAGQVRYTRYAIPLSVDVEPTFLANAIRHYVDHPAERAAIGTEAELDRLRAALAAAQPPAGQSPAA
ncbi:MAG: hypothetical protein HOV71_12065 [Hamadaea sp.]|nr:hypothetical protein [Hamadaea sp.]NUR48864.1 hypothetical protein [Hamadaea sp.]NUT05729.1 hypothetical protein [Hamadaea sp.]